MKKLLAALLIFIQITTMGQVALHGLYTPVHLNFDTTHIFLRDYLADLDFTSVELPEGLTNHSKNKDTLILTGTLPVKMATLEIATTEGPKSLLLIKSSDREITIRIPAKGLGGGPLRIIGSFNNWNRQSPPLAESNGFYQATYRLRPGSYEYKLYKDGQELLDPSNPEKVGNGMGSFNNVLLVNSGQAVNPASFFVRVGQSGQLLLSRNKPEVQYTVLWNNQKLNVPCDKSMMSTCHIAIPEEAHSIKRSYIRIFGWYQNEQGMDILIPLEYGKPVEDVSQLDRTDWHQARMYFLMVDRFKNGNPDNDLQTPDTAIQPKANYYGGDIQGVEQEVKAGFFDSLHVNTVWLSPITQNPLDAWGYWDKGTVKSKFSAYHGYWPISNIKVDFRFGTASQLTALLNDAHADQKNVILDYVANHVHIHHPVYQNHKDWVTPLYLPDGTKNTEKWDEYRLTTWFDDHLATLDLRKWKVVDPMADSALFWITHFPFDGFRHDATKHIDELYWRTLTYRIRKATDRPILQIGETYGSPQLINSYISTGMLDAQFDFNLYDATVEAFAKKDGDLQNLKNKLEQSLHTYGYHHLMGNITGNQDRSRFISLASGDVKFDEDQKLAGWERQIGKPSAEAYKRLALLQAFNNAIPGIPCIYYGDEYGMPGAGDPDNRRMMKFEGLDQDEKVLRHSVEKINELRATQLPLIYGSTDVQIIRPGVMMITRNYLGQQTIVILNTSDSGLSLELSGFKNKEGVFTGAVSSGDQIALKIPPLGFEYLIENQTRQ